MAQLCTTSLAALIGVTACANETTPVDAGNDAAVAQAVDAGNDAAVAQAVDAGPRAGSACSTGPLYDTDHQGTQGTWEEAGVPCTPHCGQEQQGRWQGTGMSLYHLESLPSGACAPNTPPCAMEVGTPCHNDPYAIWHSYVCKCVDGAWSCAGSYMGGGLCAPSDASF